MQDLEIYIRDLALDRLVVWLDGQLETLDFDDSGALETARRGSGQYRGHHVRVSVYPGAFGKRSASLILEGQALPWASDLDCARSAWRTLETEIRCSPGNWQEGQPMDEEKWWRIDARGEQQVVWN